MDVEVEALNSSRNDSVEPQLVKQVKKTSKKKKCLGIFGLVGIVLLVLAAVGIYFLVQSSRYGDDDATKDVNDSVMDVAVNYNKTHEFVITHNEEKLLEKAFNHFDTDNDGSLDIKEYRHYFASKKDLNFAFDHIDVDNDTIISFKELVFYYYSISQASPTIAQHYKSIYRHAVNKAFNYNYTTVDDQLWYEYAVSIFMKNYDTTEKGYLTKKDILLGISLDLFSKMDSDNSNSVDFNEFENANMNEKGIKYRVDNNFGGDSKKLKAINVKIEDITNLELSTCLTNNYEKLQGLDIRRLIIICRIDCTGGCTFFYWTILEVTNPNTGEVEDVFYYITDCDECIFSVVEDDETCPR